MTQQIRKHAKLPNRKVRLGLGGVFLLAAGFGPLTEEGRGACPALCGDLNASGAFTSADIILLVDYLYHDGPAPIVPDCADVDDYALTTDRDLLWLVDYHSKGVPIPDCDLDFPPLVATPSSDYKILYDPAFPAGVGLHTITIELEHSAPGRDLVLPIALWVGGAPAGIGAVTADGFATVAPAGAPANTIRFRFAIAEDSILPATQLLATVDLVMPIEACPRLIELTYTSLPPFQAGVPVHNAMVLDTALDAWLPQRCPNVIQGDVNGSGNATSADVIQMVGYVFRSACIKVLAAANVNCVGPVDIADIIVLVNYLFKNGAVCDPCL